jgi:hypothetical protein
VASVVREQLDYLRLVAILGPLFCMPWSILTIKFDTLNRSNYNLQEYLALFFGLVFTLEEECVSEDQPVLQSTDNLVLSLGNLEARVDCGLYINLLSITGTFLAASPGVLPKVRRALVSLGTSGSTQEWQIAFEFNQELGKRVEGGMWEFKTTGYYWGGRRLFRSMDDLLSDDDVEGEHRYLDEEEDGGAEAE